MNPNKIDPLQDGLSSVELIQSVGSDHLIAAAARVSYNNDLKEVSQEKDRKLIKFLLQMDHGSPLEHNLITFRIDAPLYVVQELLRHRIGVSFNQLSMRYTTPPFEGAFCPKEFRIQDTKNKQSSMTSDALDQSEAMRIYQESLNASRRAYEALIALGVAREQARGVLPHSTYTSLYVTFNIRSLVHFLKLRLAPGAQAEIRLYAQAFKELATPLFPITFSVLEELGEFNYEK